MWATIGLYSGREDNQFFQRHDDGTVERRPKGISLRAGDAVALGADTIHSVSNPSREWTGSIHTYGGDFFAAGRSMWPALDAPPSEFDSAKVEVVLEAAAAKARG